MDNKVTVNRLHELLNEAESLADAAKPGPWKSDECGDIWTEAIENPIELQNLEGKYKAVLTTTFGPDDSTAKFVAQSRTLVPRLVAALRDAQAGFNYILKHPDQAETEASETLKNIVATLEGKCLLIEPIQKAVTEEEVRSYIASTGSPIEILNRLLKHGVK